MAQEPVDSFNYNPTCTTERLYRQLMSAFTPELEIVTGREIDSSINDIKSASFHKFEVLLSTAKDLETTFNQPLTSKSARKLLQLYNRLLRLIIRGIPRGVEPLEHMIQQIERFSEPPTGFVLPNGLNYKTRHTELRCYVSELVDTVAKSKIEAFFKSCFDQHLLVPQLQNAFNKTLLPRELQKPITESSVKSADKIKLALHHVTVDWGVLVDVLYGLIILKQDETPDINSIHKIALWDKIVVISREPKLVGLVNPEWVTVRNSVDHGRAFYDPSRECIEFPDRTRKLAWSVEHAYWEAIDIYLSIEAMMRIWNFVQVAHVPVFKQRIAQLKSLAQQ